jgi:hypothetical protein
MRSPRPIPALLLALALVCFVAPACAAGAGDRPVIRPVPRQPAKLTGEVIHVTAEVDTKAEGTPISPYIYGAAMGDRQAAGECGVTIMRAGGNEVSALNWKHGYWGKGNDWFFTNYGTETPPAQNWLVKFHGENKAAGLETYLTIPTMGRVAKDGTGVAFDIRKYPGQEDWAGKHQPGDRQAFAGNGVRLVNGKKQDVDPNPDDTSVVMPPAEQADMLRFMIRDMKYGPASAGGLKFLALDNEPGLWNSTHRGMHPQGMSYDELWEKTRTYATLLKQIDPGVKIAGPCAWGWTEYFHSGLDQQLINQGKGTWQDPPDGAAHGRVPLAKWWMKKLAEHRKQTGQSLVDVLDFHFYPQTGIYNGGKVNDPQTMELRAQQTRTLWDPKYRDPSWMAGTAPDGAIRLIPMMKEWVAECNPGMQTSLGEYNFGGEQDASGGVAQAELFGVFARERVDFAFLWLFPAPNTGHWFAFHLFRNPDGHHTAFGDRYLPAKVSSPDDVSVHAARDGKSGRLTLVLVNKRAAKGARVTIELAAPVPAQDVTPYEYGAVDRTAIGQLPARKVSGRVIDVDLPAMSVLRFDVKP